MVWGARAGMCRGCSVSYFKSLNKWIDNPNAINHLTRVHILAKKNIATARDGSLQNDRIVKRHTARLMQIQCKLNNGWGYLHDLKLLLRAQLVTNVVKIEPHFSQRPIAVLLKHLSRHYSMAF
jgi:hypothetical protein